jgi:hypothetical protein
MSDPRVAEKTARLSLGYRMGYPKLHAMGYTIPTWWHCRCSQCVQQRQDKEDDLRADI